MASDRVETNGQLTTGFSGRRIASAETGTLYHLLLRNLYFSDGASMLSIYKVLSSPRTVQYSHERTATIYHRKKRSYYIYAMKNAKKLRSLLSDLE